LNGTDANPGIIDTNVFVHSHRQDEHGEECSRLLRAVERGEIFIQLEPMIVHELSYVLPRHVSTMGRLEFIEYMLTVLSWPGIQGDVALIQAALTRWRERPSLGFVDAYLGARAEQLDCPVYTKNLRDLGGLGVDVPETLPGQR